MFGMGFWELAIILLVAFLVLGPKKLPDLARTVGKGLRDLRRVSADLRSTIEEPLAEIRKPLEELRDELSETVYQVEREIQREARDEPAELAAHEAPEAVGPPTAAEQRALEDRRGEVEELYAAAAREDEAACAAPQEPCDEEPCVESPCAEPTAEERAAPSPIPTSTTTTAIESVTAAAGAGAPAAGATPTSPTLTLKS